MYRLTEEKLSTSKINNKVISNLNREGGTMTNHRSSNSLRNSILFESKGNNANIDHDSKENLRQCRLHQSTTNAVGGVNIHDLSYDDVQTFRPCAILQESQVGLLYIYYNNILL